MKIIVVGAGASGMMAAVMAARNGAEVLALEQKDAVGKKILATGNGHCNFTNGMINADCYHGNAWVMDRIKKFGLSQTLSFFEELGIYPEEKNGYYYPASGQASSVVELFLEELDRLGVKVFTDAQVKKITPVEKGFTVEYIKTTKVFRTGIENLSVNKKNHKNSSGNKKAKAEIHTERCKVSADKVILSCGGKASPKLGSDGSGYYLAGLLGHTLVEPLPALTGIQCAEEWFKELSGIRIPAQLEVSLSENKDTRSSDIALEDFHGHSNDCPMSGPDSITSQGELQLTDYGISGIPVFQISGPVARALSKGADLQIALNFHPEIDRASYHEYLKNHNEKQYTGLFPKPIIEVMKKQSGSLEAKTLLCTPVKVNDFERAQVTSGGIPIAEVDPETLESVCCPGVYITGELLDVDGICGGYNLQWAWTSGAVAGRCASGNPEG